MNPPSQIFSSANKFSYHELDTGTSSLGGPPSTPFNESLLSPIDLRSSANNRTVPYSENQHYDIAYTQLLDKYRNLEEDLTRARHDYEDLKKSHSQLTETHHSFVLAFTSGQQAARADRAPESGSSITNPETSLVATEGKNCWGYSQSDFPNIKYWTKQDWTKSGNNKNSSSDVFGSRGATRLSQGENVMCLYLEHADGTSVSGTIVSQIRESARGIWEGFKRHEMAPTTWGNTTNEVRDGFAREMERKWPVLRYCDNSWKVNAIATAGYSQWYRNKRGPKDPADNDQSELTAAAKKRKTTAEPKDSFSSPPKTRGDGITLKNPLEGTFDDSREETQFRVLETVPDIITPAINTTITENASADLDDHVMDDAYPIPSPTPNDSGETAVPLGGLSSVISTDAIASASDQSALGSALSSVNGKDPNDKRYQIQQKMVANSAVTARNLCAIDWLKSHPEGTKGQFHWHLDNLTAKEAATYKLQEKSARAAARPERVLPPKRAPRGPDVEQALRVQEPLPEGVPRVLPPKRAPRPPAN